MIVFCLAIVMVFSTVAVIYAESIYYYYGFLYTYINNDLVSLYGVEKSKTQVHMPDTLNGRKLVDISNRACMDNTDITLLEFSNAIYLERIGNSAFLGCTGISGELKLPSSLTLIEDAAFRGCSSIESLTINTLVEKIPDYCFDGCSSLSSVTFNENIHEIGYYAFSNCPNLTYIEIPASVTDIAKSAFQSDTAITLGVYTDSFAHQYAVANDISFVLLDAPAPTEPPTEPETEPVTEAPTEPVTEAPTEPATELLGYILGDVDNNGVVESIDATWIQRYSVQMELPIPEENMVQGDVDGDGETNVYDVTFIQRYVVVTA